MTKVTFYLVRHGDKMRSFGDVGLTELGKQQAKLTGQYLRDKHIDAIVSSPSKRAVETANMISDTISLPKPARFQDKRVEERMSIGEVPNQTFQEYIKLISQSVQDRDYVLPNGVSSRSAGQRFDLALREIARKPLQNIVIVSHGGIIGDFVRNIFPQKEIKRLSLAFAQFLQVNSCSITQVKLESDIFSLSLLNDTSHLGSNASS